MFAAHHKKIFVSAFFKVSIDHLFDNRESGNIIVWTEVLNFGSKDLYEPCGF